MVFTYHTKFDYEIDKIIKLKPIRKPIVDILVENISAADEVWTVSEGAGENLRSLGYKGDFRVMPNGVDFPKGRVSGEYIDEITKDFDLPDGVPVYLFVGRMMWYKGIRITLDALKLLREKKGDFRVMPNGVDMPKGRCSDESAEKIKAGIAIPGNVPVFLFVGRVTWYKGMKISLDALREYQTAGNDYRMVIVGNGLDLEAIKKYTQEIGIADKCVFTGPIYDRAALKEYFSMADLFLFPSVFDTNGLVVREAAASGLASVLIKDSCAAEGVGDGRNGFLIEENSESMAKLLFKVGGNRKLLRDVGRCAMEELYFSWEDSVSAAYHRYEQIYEKCKSRNMRRRYTPQDEVCKIIGKFYTERKKLRELEFPDAFSFGIKK